MIVLLIIVISNTRSSNGNHNHKNDNNNEAWRRRVDDRPSPTGTEVSRDFVAASASMDKEDHRFTITISITSMIIV